MPAYQMNSKDIPEDEMPGCNAEDMPANNFDKSITSSKDDVSVQNTNRIRATNEDETPIHPLKRKCKRNFKVKLPSTTRTGRLTRPRQNIFKRIQYPLLLITFLSVKLLKEIELQNHGQPS